MSANLSISNTGSGAWGAAVAGDVYGKVAITALQGMGGIGKTALAQKLPELYSVSQFLRIRGREFEGIRWMQIALQAAHTLDDRKQEGVLLNNLGYAHSALGQKDKALDLYQQALVIYREVGDR